MKAQRSTAGGWWRVVSSNSWPTNITLYSGTNRHCHKCCHCAEAPPRPPGNTAVSWLVVCPDFNRVKNKSYSSLVTGLFWLHSEKIYWKKIYRCETPASTLAAAATVCSGLPGRPAAWRPPLVAQTLFFSASGWFPAKTRLFLWGNWIFIEFHVGDQYSCHLSTINKISWNKKSRSLIEKKVVLWIRLWNMKILRQSLIPFYLFPWGRENGAQTGHGLIFEGAISWKPLSVNCKIEAFLVW